VRFFTSVGYAGRARAEPSEGALERWAAAWRVLAWTGVAAGIGLGGFLRVWRLNALGYNSDEAVYAGQAASIAQFEHLMPFFPVFRAHPLLFQMIHSLGYRISDHDLVGRLISAGFGFGTIILVYLLGSMLYGRKAGAIAAVFIALMPYDVIVSRQVLLDGPTTFCATLALYLVARYAHTRQPPWLYAAGAAMGLAILGKETSILMVGAGYAFFALSPELATKLRHLVITVVLMFGVMAVDTATRKLAGASRSGENYLAYQLFRRPNHGWTFYAATVPVAIGVLVMLAALAGLWLLRRDISWRETLLLSWIFAPFLFFQLYPVKGFQYLLPIAPAVAVLAGRTLGRWSPRKDVLGIPRSWIGPGLAAGVALSLAIPTWQRIQPSISDSFLAGSGGVPGGREVGHWIKQNVPEGAQFLTVGPSMANIVQFYGQRRAYGLSVGTNPLRRNPAYDPLANPDLSIRTNEVQYVVWDAFSAARSTFFANKLLQYARRYNGRAVRTETMLVKTRGGERVRKPLIVVYAVRP
jgi:hypothetical protein